MKKGQPLCSVDFSVSLGFEKLVSVFSIAAFGYILSSAIGVREGHSVLAFAQLSRDGKVPLISKSSRSHRSSGPKDRPFQSVPHI